MIKKFKNGSYRISGNDANEFVKALRGDHEDDIRNEDVDDFNKNYSVGDKVRVRGDDGEEFIDEVRYPASVMGGHTAMAWLKGKGSYLLSRVIGKVE